MDFALALYGALIYPLTAIGATIRVDRSRTASPACSNGADEQVSGMP